MASTSPITSKFLLIKWIFVESEHKGIPNFSVSRVYYNFVEERVGLNDFENSFLCEQDSKFYGDLLKKHVPMWVEVIENAKGERNIQSGFITVECKNETKYVEVKELLEKQNIYAYRELAWFPWMQSYYYEDSIVDVKFQ